MLSLELLLLEILVLFFLYKLMIITMKINTSTLIINYYFCSKMLIHFLY